MGHFLLVVHWNQVCIEVLSHKHIWATNLTGSRDVIGHVTIWFPSVTLAFDSEVAISYRCSFDTKSVSSAVFEIMGPKDIWVMTWTFLGHVTSSVTWPFELQYVISYWCSIGSKCLSLTNSEIFCPNLMCHRHNAKSSLRMRDITWHVPLCTI